MCFVTYYQIILPIAFYFKLHRKTKIMQTERVKKRLLEIIDSKLSEENDIDDFDCITLKYCDNFGKKTVLDVHINACFERVTKTKEPYIAYVNVDKLDLLDESGDEVLSISQRKELTKFIKDYVYEYYKKLTNN